MLQMDDLNISTNSAEEPEAGGKLIPTGSQSDVMSADHWQVPSPGMCADSVARMWNKMVAESRHLEGELLPKPAISVSDSHR